MNLYKFYSNPEELDHYDTLGKKIDDQGRFVYRNEMGRPHRDNDQPAIICANGVRYWFENGINYNPNSI